jgi:uncharacterized tellurite resistance protein B-like protein
MDQADTPDPPEMVLFQGMRFQGNYCINTEIKKYISTGTFCLTECTLKSCKKCSLNQNLRLDPLKYCVMILSMSLLQLLKRNLDKNKDSSTTTETVRKITRQLDKFEPTEAKYFACFAYLLSRTAGADSDISSEETETMENIVAEKSGMSEEQAIIVVQMAKTQNLLFGGTENYLVAREFKDLSTQQQRLALLDCLFAVAASHEGISAIEDNEISQIADELRIEHRDFISVRSRYRNYLAVLKKD